jgi:hypothetical protein
VAKYLYIVVGLIISIAALSLLNILGLLDYFSSSGIDRVVDTFLLIALIAVLIPLVLLLLRSRKVLDRWTDMFERNTIATAMRIAMTRRGKEEAILALAQSVDEISEPLEEYIMSEKSDLREFLDISIGDGITSTYDILIDSSHLLNGDNKNKGNSLRKVLEDYGAVIIKIVDGYVDRRHVELFVDSLAKYAFVSKNQVGLGIIVGEDISPEAKESVSKFISEKRRGGLPINHLLLIDKPSSPPAPPLHSTDQSSTTQ